MPSAVAAGITVFGVPAFAPAAAPAARDADLRAAGAVAVTDEWDELADLLLTTDPRTVITERTTA